MRLALNFVVGIVLGVGAWRVLPDRLFTHQAQRPDPLTLHIVNEPPGYALRPMVFARSAAWPDVKAAIERADEIGGADVILHAGTTVVPGGTILLSARTRLDLMQWTRIYGDVSLTPRSTGSHS